MNGFLFMKKKMTGMDFYVYLNWHSIDFISKFFMHLEGIWYLAVNWIL